MEPLVTFDVVDGIGHLRLREAARGNPVSLPSVLELLERVQEARRSGVGVLLLSAEGRFFCVGGDLEEFRSSEDPESLVEDIAGTMHRVIAQLVRMDAVVVVAVNGGSAGGGTPLIFAGDVIVAAESARITLAYTRTGLSPDGGSTVLIPPTFGLHRTLQMALLNTTIDAEEARALGLFAEVVPDAELADRAMALCRKLAAGPVDSLIASKHLIRANVPAPESAMEQEARSISYLVARPNAQEGMRAFFEKRKPVFPN